MTSLPRNERRDRDGSYRAVAEGLQANTRYRMRIRAVNTVGAGEWSGESAWAWTERIPPSKPANHGARKLAAGEPLKSRIHVGISASGTSLLESLFLPPLSERARIETPCFLDTTPGDHEGRQGFAYAYLLVSE